MTEPEINVEELLKELGEIRDRKERMSLDERKLSERQRDIESELDRFSEKTGLQKFVGAGLSISFDRNAMRAKYSPDKWPDIIKWAVESGNDHIIQRRMTDAKVLDLIDSGVALPDGLTVESYTKISTRKV